MYVPVQRPRPGGPYRHCMRNQETGTRISPDHDSAPDNDRAQPGDVLGIERDGEITHLGETREDEDERREEAEEEIRDERETS